MVDDRTAIERLYTANVAALNAKDIPALTAFYTADAIQLPPDGPPLKGQEAIRSSLEQELRGITVNAEVEVEEVIIAGNWAYARGEYRSTTTPQGGGEGTVARGSWLDILQRQSDGSWRISRSTWSNYGIEREQV